MKYKIFTKKKVRSSRKMRSKLKITGVDVTS